MLERCGRAENEATSRDWRFWLGLLAVISGAGIRLWLWLNSAETQMLFGDSSLYQGLAEDFPAKYLKGHPDSYRNPPLYPLFLSLFDTVRGAMFAQVAVSVGLIVLTWRWAAMISTEFGAAVAAWLVAVEPVSIEYSMLVMSEMLFTAILLMAIYITWRAATRKSLWNALAGGLLFSAAAFTRPIAVFLPPLVAGAIWLVTRRWKVSFTITVCAVLLLGGWVARNIIGEDLYAFGTLQSRNLLYWRAAGVLAQQENGNPIQVRFYLQDERQDRSYESLGERARVEHAEALRIITENPLDYFKASIQPTLNMMFRVFGQLQILIFALVYGLASLGAIELWRKDRLLAVLLVLSIAYLVLLAAAPGAHPRFRVTFWPLIALLSASGVQGLISAGKGSHGPRRGASWSAGGP